MSTPASPDHLSPEYLAEMIDLTSTGLPMPPDATPERIAARRETARVSLMSLDPRTPQEAMLASQIVLAQFASIECFRRIALPDTPELLRIRHHSNAAAMMRLSRSLSAELHRGQAQRAARARAAQQSATQVAAPAHPSRPTPAAYPAAPAASAPKPHAQPINPMQSGKLPGIGAPLLAAAQAPAYDPADLKEIARRAVAAATARAA